jgi:hypothetical protein
MERMSGITLQINRNKEHCRGVLLQFLLNYPQRKGRLRTQTAFIVNNLSYVFESGRLSVMELLGAIIAKFDSALVQEYTGLLFIALFMVLADDDAAKCRGPNSSGTGEIPAPLLISIISFLQVVPLWQTRKPRRIMTND